MIFVSANTGTTIAPSSEGKVHKTSQAEDEKIYT